MTLEIEAEVSNYLGNVSRVWGSISGTLAAFMELGKSSSED